MPDEIFQMLYLVSQNENSKFHKNAKEYAHVRICDRPKKRLDAMIDLRAELLTMSDEFYSKVKGLTDRILSEIHDPKADEGLLELDKDSYLSCFNVDLREFDDLLVQEIKNKKNELQQAEESARRLTTQMQSILSTSQEELKTFLQDTKYEVE